MLIFLFGFYGIFIWVFYSAEFCNNFVLKSFGLWGLVEPNKTNILCPNIGKNCCSQLDQLSLYKGWQELYLTDLSSFYQSQQGISDKLKQIYVQNLSVLNLETLTKQFKQIVQQAILPSQFELQHLQKLITYITKIDINQMVQSLNQVISLEDSYYKAIIEARKGFYCSICKYEIGKSVSLAGQRVIYHPNMCSDLLNNYYLFVKSKAQSLYQIMLIYDELFYTIFHKELITSNFDRQLIHKYLLETVQCDKEGFAPNAKAKNNSQNAKIQKSCQKICQNFHLNNFTLLFDGDLNLINDFLSNLSNLVQQSNLYQDNGSKDIVFNTWNNFMFAQKVKFRLETYSILKKNYQRFNTQQNDLRTVVDIRFNSKMNMDLHSLQNKSYLKVESGKIKEQMSLDTFWQESLDLFPITSKPVYLNTLRPSVDWRDSGINVFEDVKRNNFDVNKEAFLSLLENDSSNLKNLGEVLLQEIQDLMTRVGLKDILEFQTDHSLVFLEYNQLLQKSQMGG